ncbi:hypothetical protein P4534_05595 [Peribacillus butanolivorans]|uniref:hypothetical protein n=1 Tax=Peribacillus butanolivorans TaxID=421767 RepID=UPI002E22E497|nr:hypothetical protein [Peribacillus butanolivorans]
MSHSWKRTISYLSYLILLLSVLLYGLKYQHHLEIISRETYEVKGYFLFQSFFPIFIGVIFAIPSIVKNFLTKGHWKMNWVRLLILGLPFIYMSIIPILYFTEIIEFELPFSTLVWGGYFGADGSTTFNSITGIIAGYIVLTSIRKPTDIQ